MSICDAVTAILECEGRILLVRRQPALAAFPGYWAFPGGKVDAADAGEPARGHAFFTGFEPRLVQAIVRELREEISWDLDAAVAGGDVTAFHLVGTALTPPIQPLRFNTWFFRIALGGKPALQLDPGEVDALRWERPSDIVAEYESGHLLMAPPTINAVRLLAAGEGRVPSAHVLENQDRERLPLLQPLAGLRLIPVRSHTLPPAIHTNCFVLGDEGTPRILVDPSPWSDEELDALFARVTPLGIRRVFITHHHPDHHERADALARRLGVGISMSADTAERIAVRQPRFFDGLPPHQVSDGDIVATWLGQPVRALAVPGHDRGQLALMPDDRAWCIVGDLIQGIGTVVIHKPEGNMRAYFASLQRIIDLDPKVIIPSHGMAMGSTYRLRETLRHRRQREAEVLALHRDGRSLDDMLAVIYQGLDARLLPLARQNIESHLDKLREEGALA